MLRTMTKSLKQPKGAWNLDQAHSTSFEINLKDGSKVGTGYFTRDEARQMKTALRTDGLKFKVIHEKP